MSVLFTIYIVGVLLAIALLIELKRVINKQEETIDNDEVLAVCAILTPLSWVACYYILSCIFENKNKY